jgi:hypothetical protein
MNPRVNRINSASTIYYFIIFLRSLKMNKKIAKVLLSALLVPAAIVPAFANTAQLTLTASVADFVTINIVNSKTTAVVSNTIEDTNSADLIGVLNFGNVDARGVSLAAISGTASDTTNAPSGVVIREASTNKVYDRATPPALASGALYFINGVAASKGYSIITSTTDNSTAVSVANGAGATAFDVLVDTATNVTLPGTSGTTVVADTSILAPGTSNASLAASLANNTQLPITVGLYIKNTTPTSAVSSTLTFTGV